MGSFLDFVSDINSRIGIQLPSSLKDHDEIKVAQRFLEKLNEYFFQTYKGIGNTNFDDEEIQYFSDFHKFWEKNYSKILNAQINKNQTLKAAKSLCNAVKLYGETILNVTHDTKGLPNKAIAQVRFFTANQDFRQPPENQYQKYYDDPSGFDEQNIREDPESFLKLLGVNRQSQTDKRLDFAQNAAKFLVDKNIRAYEIAQYFDQDALKIREALINEPNIGYGLKKANIFIRDMVALNVWPRLLNFDAIDIASDINTMKLTLRSGLLKTDIPLLSSFLDIFCYQYGYIDEKCADSWRKVWEEWKKLEPSTAPDSPSRLDYLLYRIGREYCDNIVVEYQCDRKHRFYHFGARLKKCRVCESKSRTPAYPKDRYLPCQIEISQLPHEGNQLLLPAENLLRVFKGKCILSGLCDPCSQGFKALNPPKSISIKGQTSWTSAYAYRDRGGGGLMS